MHLLLVKTVVVEKILLVGMHLLDLATVKEYLPYEFGRLLLAFLVLFCPLLLFPLQFLLLVRREAFLCSS